MSRRFQRIRSVLEVEKFNTGTWKCHLCLVHHVVVKVRHVSDYRELTPANRCVKTDIKSVINDELFSTVLLDVLFNCMHFSFDLWCGSKLFFVSW